MKISSVEAYAVRIPRNRSKAERSAGSPTPLETRLGQYAWSTVFPTLYAADFETALIKVALDDGTAGWGEAQAPLAPEVACTIVRLLLAPVLVGAEFAGAVSEIEALWDKMYATMRVRGQTGGFMLDAISGIDIALWDLAGKMQGRPVSALISHRRLGATPAYLSGVAGRTVEERVEHAAMWQVEGFTTFKLFYDCGRDEFLSTVKAMRERLGSDEDRGRRAVASHAGECCSLRTRTR